MPFFVEISYAIAAGISQKNADVRRLSFDDAEITLPGLDGMVTVFSTTFLCVAASLREKLSASKTWQREFPTGKFERNG